MSQTTREPRLPPPAMPEAVEPMKAVPGEVPESSEGWQSEVKWDGYRAIGFCSPDGGLRLQGRRLNDITAKFPEVRPLGRQAAARGTVLDGELVVFDRHGVSSFQLMQARLGEGGQRATFVIFDLLHAGGEDLRGHPYEERRERLEALGLQGDSWRVPGRLDGDVGEVLGATAGLGLEGIVIKRATSPYVEGARSGHWLKLKNQRRQEFVIGGWLPGKGARAGMIGALLAGYHERPGEGALRYAGRVGTGFDLATLDRLGADLEAIRHGDPPFAGGDLGAIPRNAIWVEPLRVVEVRFSDWTRDGRLRHPVYLGARPDKDPGDVVREDPA